MDHIAEIGLTLITNQPRHRMAQSRISARKAKFESLMVAIWWHDRVGVAKSSEAPEPLRHTSDLSGFVAWVLEPKPIFLFFIPAATHPTFAGMQMDGGILPVNFQQKQARCNKAPERRRGQCS